MKYLKRASCHVTGRRRCQSIPGFSELQKILSTPQPPPHFSWEKSFLRWTISIGSGTKRTDCPLQFYLPGDHHHRNKSCLYLSDKHPTHQLNEIKYSEKCLILKGSVSATQCPLSYTLLRETRVKTKAQARCAQGNTLNSVHYVPLSRIVHNTIKAFTFSSPPYSFWIKLIRFCLL